MRFADKEDLVEVNAWREARKAPILSDDFYPPVGMIIPGLAAGFLVTTNTAVAFLEHFVTNPAAPVVERRKAVAEIATELEKIALNNGFKMACALTKNASIANMAMQLGYMPIANCELFGKELGYGSG